MNNFDHLLLCVCVCSLRGIKVEQRTLNDNASSLVDMAKVSTTLCVVSISGLGFVTLGAFHCA